ncbi:MAG: CvpA family protein [Candidatus Marinimicrobia bacterium]|jgi:membrane protein required for colicin V production|nr:CvpA family protein [Candidatus Neomarinimicrobiota bacterium]MBT3675208.1 CvpA family protein [Candidatus Neomarinimicrobiota bacterium]MBT3762628.1 CvpA family protein [Candidatus Neomarinimicrobiota bacterium]MBT4068322.1 CvpA family protein [Candidatus Neomarinimicrobiota bacterium]MBT4270169.1 CvpA family protein [Candidatus Neomarinimicrobiota bacterium]
MIDALATFFIIAIGLIGFRRGLVEEMGRLLGIIFATVFALRLYVDLGSFLMVWLPVDVWLLFVLSFIIIFSGVLLLTRFITKLIHFLFLSKSTKWVNRIMGTSFGIIKGLLVVMIFFWMFELLPNRDTSNIVMKQSKLAQRLINVRKNIITTFNWKDPVELGEKTIREFLNTMENNNG